VYEYAATVTAVHDGDTLDADISLGFHLWLRAQPIRLTGCNARELNMPGGHEARDHLAALLPPGTVVKLRTLKPDKFGDRVDASVVLADGTDLVAQLVAQQWAAAWDGTGPKPVPLWPRTV
jgi:micrococcal nuclease